MNLESSHMKAVTRLHITSLTNNQAMAMHCSFFFCKFCEQTEEFCEQIWKPPLSQESPVWVLLHIAIHPMLPPACWWLQVWRHFQISAQCRAVTRKPRLAIVDNGKYNLGWGPGGDQAEDWAPTLPGRGSRVQHWAAEWSQLSQLSLHFFMLQHRDNRGPPPTTHLCVPPH